MRRLFNGRERIALYLVADGKCQECKKELGAVWHADHIVPFSKGGETHVSNGQALCAGCNLTKGCKVNVAA